MEKMELYHFHKRGEFDGMWREKQEIIVPTDFESTTYKRFKNFSTAVQTQYGQVNLYDLILLYKRQGMSDEKIVKIITQKSYEISFNANEFKRENAMENYRLAHTPNLPSRLHSVYLTDEKGIEAWSGKFGRTHLVLYRVEVEGNIFKTNEQLIPEEELSYQKFYDKSEKYWNPVFTTVPDNANEYLAQGKIKVLEKIKRI